MLKFTYVINLGVVGALVVPAAIQGGGSVEQLEGSLRATDLALTNLEGVQESLARGEYAAVEAILAATEAPFGGARERSVLMDQLRFELGELENKVQEVETTSALQHLHQDPTDGLQTTPGGDPKGMHTPTTGLSPEERTEVGNIWPPIPGQETPAARETSGPRSLEDEGFTVDAVRQGRAYYRAKRYTEALRLFKTREGEPEADYWMGRCYERLERNPEAVAAYTRVIDNEASGALAERATVDRDFLRWMIDFERKLSERRKREGRSQ